MKTILFAIALPIEFKIIKQYFIENKPINFKVDFVLTWVWSLSTIYNLKDYLDKKQKPDFLVNIWVCWKSNWWNDDLFQVYKIKNLSNLKEAISPVYIDFLELKKIICSDEVLTSNEKMQNYQYVDMESFWFDYLASKEKIPYIIIKKPFDEVWDNSKKLSLKDLENSLKNIDFELLLQKISEYLENNKPILEERELDKFKKKYELTFSQVEILKKYFYKNLSKWLWKNDIFKALRKLDKNDFLQKIKQ